MLASQSGSVDGFSLDESNNFDVVEIRRGVVIHYHTMVELCNWHMP